MSRRTVFRDLKELQSIGVPYKYNAKSNSYIINPKFFLPPIDFNLQEALSLLMLVHKMQNHLPMPYKNSAFLAGLKVENNLPAEIRQYCQNSLAKVTVASGQHAAIKLLDNVYNIIQQAIRKKVVLHVSCSSLCEDGDINTVLRPYHLLYKKWAWYVIGYSSLHRSVRIFHLGRIREATAIDKRFTDGLGEILWWVLGYGDQVQVLAPAALRKRVLEKARNLIKIHKKL